jgi:hypothetical protein
LLWRQITYQGRISERLAGQAFEVNGEELVSEQRQYRERKKSKSRRNTPAHPPPVCRQEPFFGHARIEVPDRRTMQKGLAERN